MFKKLNAENDDFILGSEVAQVNKESRPLIPVWEIIARANTLLINAEWARERLEEDPHNEELQEKYAEAIIQYEDYLNKAY